MDEPETTRRSLHAVAELLLAGPQYATSGTIRLHPTPGGFGTVQAPDVRVRGASLVVADRSVPLHGRTVAAVAEEAGLTPRALDDVYADGCGLSTEHTLVVDDAAAAEIATAFMRGDEALALLAPDADRVIWPEHFDLGITLDKVNYGVSPGDSYLAVPYAYVGPWSPDTFSGPFWNSPFGAARALADIPDLVAFFTEGRGLTLA